MIVVLPETTQQVADILRYCKNAGVKIVPRGAGTGLSGGALPLADGVLLGLGKFNRILDIDFDNRAVVTQPGVTNLGITHAVQDEGFYYAPDPSSQIACSIGGNIAENSGGVHCLKYGLTTNNVLGVEFVTINGEILRFGGKHLESDGYDFLGLITGSEGLLGVVTEVTVRILRKPSTARAVLIGFPAAPEEAGACVAAVIGAGILPGGMEMMDNPAINAAEDFVHAGYPRDVGALLIVELDGPSRSRLSDRPCPRNRRRMARLLSIPARARSGTCSGADTHGVPGCRSSRQTIFAWTARFRASSSGNPVPHESAMSKHNLRVANVFHAGDGNLHPLILFDANKKGELERAEAFGADILTACVELGGVLTGEHGVGIEKRDLMGEMFTEVDLNQQLRVKCAFDPDGLLDPGKVFPQLHRCAELGRMHVRAGQLPFPDIPRF